MDCFEDAKWSHSSPLTPMGKHEESQLKEISSLEALIDLKGESTRKMAHRDNSFLVHYEIKYTRKV